MPKMPGLGPERLGSLRIPPETLTTCKNRVVLTFLTVLHLQREKQAI